MFKIIKGEGEGRRVVYTRISTERFKQLEEISKKNNITKANLIKQMIEYCFNEGKEKNV